MAASHKVAVLEDLLERVRRNARNPAEALAARAASRAAPAAVEAPPPSEVVQTIRREVEHAPPRGGRSETIEGPPPIASEKRTPTPAAVAPATPATPAVAARPSLFDELPKAAAASEPDPESSRYTTKVQGTPVQSAARTRESDKDAARAAEAEKRPRVVALAPPLGAAPPAAAKPNRPAEPPASRAMAPTRAPIGRATLPSSSPEFAAPRAPLPSTSTEAEPPPSSRRMPPPVPSRKAPPAPPSTRGSIPDAPRPRMDSRLDAKPADAAAARAPVAPKPLEPSKRPDLLTRVPDKRGTLLGMGQNFADALKAEMLAAGNAEYEEDNTAKMSASLLAEARAAMGERSTARPEAASTPPPAPAIAPVPAVPSLDLDAPTMAKGSPLDLDAPTVARAAPPDLDAAIARIKAGDTAAAAPPRPSSDLPTRQPLFGLPATDDHATPMDDDDDGDPLLKTVVAGASSLPIRDSARSEPPPSSQNLAATVQLSATEARERLAAMIRNEDTADAATTKEPPPFPSSSAPTPSEVAMAPTVDFGGGGLGDLSLDLPTEEPPALGLPIAEPSAASPRGPVGVHVPTLQSATIDPAVIESARALESARSGAPSDAKWATPPSSATPTAAKPKGRTTLWIGVAAFLAVVVGGGIFLALRSGDLSDTPPTPAPQPTGKAAPSATPTAPSTATAANTAAPASAAASAAPSATAAASAAPSASAAASAAPSASAAASAAPSAAPVASAAPTAPPAAGPAPDGSGLADGMGYLIVQSSVPADVYVNGKMVGAAGQPLEVPCGARYLRIGKPGQPNFFISEGQSHQVACKSATTITINPTPFTGGAPSHGGAPAPAPANNNDPY